MIKVEEVKEVKKSDGFGGFACGDVSNLEFCQTVAIVSSSVSSRPSEKERRGLIWKIVCGPIYQMVFPPSHFAQTQKIFYFPNDIEIKASWNLS